VRDMWEPTRAHTGTHGRFSLRNRLLTPLQWGVGGQRPPSSAGAEDDSPPSGMGNWHTWVHKATVAGVSARMLSPSPCQGSTWVMHTPSWVLNLSPTLPRMLEGGGEEGGSDGGGWRGGENGREGR
jgi:hypothetical protein